jgi:hypothetical protein
LVDKQATLGAHLMSHFTVPHFDGSVAVVVQQNLVTTRDLNEALRDAVRASVPARRSRDHSR